MKTRSPNLISVVVPAYNEEGNVASHTAQLSQYLVDQGEFEIIWVNDGSSDETLRAVRELASRDKRVKYVSLSRNFGHQIAIKAGLDFAKGDCVIVIDADGEHPPSLIPEMVKLWRDGSDLVLTRRLDSESLSYFKRISGPLFYKLMARVSGVPIDSGSADFRLMDRKVVNVCRRFGERDLFWRGVVAWIGFTSTSISYVQGIRSWGRSRYTLARMISFSISGLTSFSTKPLSIGIFVGMLFAAIAFGYGLYAVYIKLFTDHAVSGWASLLAGIMFLSAVQLIVLGIIGVYIGKIFQEVKGRPQYIVDSANCDFNPIESSPYRNE